VWQAEGRIVVAEAARALGSGDALRGRQYRERADGYDAMRTLLFMLLILCAAAVAVAHVNDRGMDYGHFKDRYGQSCCGDKDCRPAADFVETLVNGEAVVRLLIDGAWITVPQSYVVSERASDGRAHFCGNLHKPRTNQGEVKPEPTCIILPPRAT